MLVHGKIPRDVTKISSRWDYVDGRQVLWVTLKHVCQLEKPTDRYFTQLPAIIYIPVTPPPQHYDCQYPFIHLGKERQCGVKFLVYRNNTMAEQEQIIEYLPL